MSIDELSSMPNQLLAIKNTKIFVVGDLILDTYIEGKVTRISPEAPVPVLLEKGERFVLGGAGNVAANIASMGAEVFLCGRIGNDIEGNKLKTLLSKLSIESTYLIVSSNVPTTTKTRVLSGNIFSSGSQQIMRIDNELIEPLTEEEENKVLTQFISFAEVKNDSFSPFILL